ncbi:MAG: peptide-methionine (S)-S-oxide reductase MsrA [Phycisphaeraceae bacterium]
MAKATFAAGCFWGVEELFRRLEGVEATSVGYIGGSTDEPDYEQVCSGRTGHAEAVEVIYDPQKVSYEDLLQVFWENHDPTTPNRQGPDVGTQYRSAIFYHDEQQRQAAEALQKQLEKSGRFANPISTEIGPAGTFWRGEEYHQQYLAKRGAPGCHL